MANRVPPQQEQAETTLDRYVSEAYEAREHVRLPEIDSTPHELQKAIHETRAAMDRVESVLASAIKARGSIKVLLGEAKAAYEDAWAQEAGRKGVGFAQEDAAPRERYAAYDQRCLSQLIEHRQLERLERKADTAVEVIRVYHRGIDSVRRDLELRVRLLNVESYLER